MDELTSTASSETDESTPLLASRRDSSASVIVTKKKASFSLVRPILKQWLPMLIAVSCYIFPAFILFFLIFAHFGGLGVRVLRLGAWIGFLGCGFQLMGLGPLVWGFLGFVGLGLSL